MIIRNVEKKDFGEINRLYNDVYEGFYPLPETYNKKIFDEALDDDSHLWLVSEDEGGKIVASIILVGNREKDICKCYGAAVKKEFQEKGVMYELHSEAEKRSECRMYYSIARMNNMAPQKLLRKLGFMPFGIFPNAMRVKTVETHGLFVSYKGGIIEEREKPVIIKPFEAIYSCASDILHLGKAEIVEESGIHPGRAVDLRMSVAPSVSMEWTDYMNYGSIELSYFPFFKPNLKLYSSDLSTEIFIYYNPMAAHMYILGIKTTDPMYDVLEGIASAALSMGCYYIECVVPAESPELQSAMYESGFLPSAYFPAFKKKDGSRSDCFINCRLLLPPSFREVRTDDMNKRFLKAYSDIYTERVRRDLYGWSDR
ncbi:MAG: GNAT family N-acetyltransferase [Candidatus Thermoplasmatota archaeon]|nr:GNAT family N-acetyltransferase [Candidatus Thermoplasmatota archaeon]